MVLELGGKAPLVALDDADVDDAVNAAPSAALPTQGQICMSTERIIVDAKIADAFVPYLRRQRPKLRRWATRKARAGGAGLGGEHGHGGHCNALIDDALAKRAPSC